MVEPFLKWVGGKRQLLNEIRRRLPEKIKETKCVDTYIEPFLGGGAVFFYLKSNFKVKNSFLFDLNREVVVGYKVVQNNPSELINLLEGIQSEFTRTPKEKRKSYFYEIKEKYNTQMISFDYNNYNKEWIKRAAYMIFFNNTCFSRIFRFTKKGELSNAPSGDIYKKGKKIYSAERIIQAHNVLKDAEIFCGDFTESERYMEKECFVYLDPPYFLSNVKNGANDLYGNVHFVKDDQVRLSEFFRRIDKKGVYLMLSNSDLKSKDPNNDFFDRLYDGYVINKVPVRYSISYIIKNRGVASEIIVTNYKYKTDINLKISDFL